MKLEIEKKERKLIMYLGNLYGERTWVEYGFRQCKQELGWTDYRLTKAEDIMKWWEIINSVYCLISLKTTILPWLRMMKNKILWIGFNDLLGCANHYMNHFLTG